MKLLRQQQPPAMQSVYGEEKICAVVKVEDQNLFGLGFFFPLREMKCSLSAPFSTGWEISGMQHSGNRRENKE